MSEISHRCTKFKFEKLNFWIQSDTFWQSDFKENSKKYKVKLEDELRRVMVHGLLHLLGYDDKNEKEKKRIRKKENYYLKMY